MLNPELRAYHLAVTDLFVEKAIAYLEDHATSYNVYGKWASLSAIGVVFCGTCLALVHMLGWLPVEGEKTIGGTWDAALRFSRSFTTYGMIVLLAVFLWRWGRAMLDQSERLMERRHALRQGRLFVHLNDGHLSIDEMEKAFNWNQSQSNAFANIRDDAQAPWGAVTKELSRSVAELVRAGIQATLKTQSSTRKGNGNG